MTNVNYIKVGRLKFFSRCDGSLFKRNLVKQTIAQAGPTNFMLNTFLPTIYLDAQ